MNPAQRAALKEKLQRNVQQSRAGNKTAESPVKDAVENQPEPRVTYTCGHHEPIKNLTSQKCGGCRKAARQEKAKKNRDKIAEKIKTANDSQRLPDESLFELQYEAENKEWRGVLCIDIPNCKHPSCSHKHIVHYFHERASGVFRLLQKLDTLYREHLKLAST